jgi:hypothetical protein
VVWLVGLIFVAWFGFKDVCMIWEFWNWEWFWDMEMIFI